MYLHLGRDIAVSQNTIIGIFDLDTSTFSKYTKAYLTQAEQQCQVVTVSDELPKSMVVCMEEGRQVVYISQISSQTLLKRAYGTALPDSFLT